MNGHPTKVFIVDDSVLIRYALTQLLNKEEDIIVVGDAAASEHLVSQVEKAGPDILFLDIPIPRETGIQQLRKLHHLHLPAIIFTKSDKTIARDLIPLLEAGAVGFILKPEKDEDVTLVREQILHELHVNKPSHQPLTPLPSHKITTEPVSFLDPLRVVAIGSSTGGPEALSLILAQFPDHFPAGVAIVQHMPADFTPRFAERLNALSKLTVKEAEEGDVLKPGLALLAPGDFHMTFVEVREGQRRLARVRLTKEPPQWKLRPTVDKMMTTLAPIYHQNILGVVLTGMGEDGVVGTRAIKQAGGRTIVQNKATSVVFGMAQEVIKNNLADEVLPLNEIIPRICEILRI